MLIDYEIIFIRPRICTFFFEYCSYFKKKAVLYLNCIEPIDFIFSVFFYYSKVYLDGAVVSASAVSLHGFDFRPLIYIFRRVYLKFVYVFSNVSWHHRHRSNVSKPSGELVWKHVNKRFLLTNRDLITSLLAGVKWVIPGFKLPNTLF